MTIRETAKQAVIEQVDRRAALEHEGNYHKLHVHRDGALDWTESINHSDDIIDDQADGFAAIPNVVCVGTGSCDCNCDYCNEVGTVVDGTEYTTTNAIQDAVADSDLTDVQDMMLAAFDDIPVGYFDDEESPI